MNDNNNNNTQKKSPKKSLLFSPITLGSASGSRGLGSGVTLKNRICVSPMGQCSALDGVPQDYHVVHYGALAAGGAGMVMVEATNVEPRGMVTRGCTGIWNDQQVDGWRRVTAIISQFDSVPAIQLAHGGPKASCVAFWDGYQSLADGDDGGWPTIGPSPRAWGGPIWRVPAEASVEDIQEIRSKWLEAAKRSVRAGFRVIELHFAHGYLVSSFLSPATNHRRDQYGGSLENRMRLALEIVADVRQAVADADIVLGVRISVTDYVEVDNGGGWDLRQTMRLAEQLKQLDVDFLDCSSGGVVMAANDHPLSASSVQHEAARLVQQTLDWPTAVVGQIVDPLVAEQLLSNNCAQLVMIGRAMLDNPHWPYRAADELGVFGQEFRAPKQYNWCIGGAVDSVGNWRQTVLNRNSNRVLAADQSESAQQPSAKRRLSERLIEASAEIYGQLLATDFVQQLLIGGEMSASNRAVARRSQKQTLELMPRFQQLFRTAIELTDSDGERQFFRMSIQAWDQGFREYCHSFQEIFGQLTADDDQDSENTRQFAKHLTEVSTSGSVLKILTTLLAGCVKLWTVYDYVRQQQHRVSSGMATTTTTTNPFVEFLLFRSMKPEMGMKFIGDLIDARSGSGSGSGQLAIGNDGHQLADDELIDVMRQTAIYEMRFHSELI